MREQFFKLLQDHEFIGRGVSSKDDSVNVNSTNMAVVKAILCSGMDSNPFSLGFSNYKGKGLH